MKSAKTTNYKTGAAAVVGLLSSAITYAFLMPSIDTSDQRRHRLTLAGKLKLKLLRAVPNKAFLAVWNRGRKTPDRPVQSIGERWIPTRYAPVYCKIYYPFHETGEPLPVYVSLHGGGFVFRGIDQDDAHCRYFASEVPCVVINVDYSVAPENPFPQPVYECFDVVNWVAQNGDLLRIDTRRMAIGGYSAGGNLAAAVALMNRHEKAFLLSLQVLNYAPLNHVESAQEKNLLPRKQLVTPSDFDYFTTAYLPYVEQRSNPLASPVLADMVQGLPPALIITAAYDLLKTDGEQYAKRLTEGGVSVDYQEFKGVDHGFTHVGPVEQAVSAWNLIARSLTKAFNQSA